MLKSRVRQGSRNYSHVSIYPVSRPSLILRGLQAISYRERIFPPFSFLQKERIGTLYIPDQLQQRNSRAQVKILHLIPWIFPRSINLARRGRLVLLRTWTPNYAFPIWKRPPSILESGLFPPRFKRSKKMGRVSYNSSWMINDEFGDLLPAGLRKIYIYMVYKIGRQRGGCISISSQTFSSSSKK